MTVPIKDRSCPPHTIKKAENPLGLLNRIGIFLRREVNTEDNYYTGAIKTSSKAPAPKRLCIELANATNKKWNEISIGWGDFAKI
jgi:hypothetical protein